MVEELQRRGWQEADLIRRRKNDLGKLEIAARLRRETTLTIKAIAARVHLRSCESANAKLNQHLRARATNPQESSTTVQRRRGARMQNAPNYG